MVIQVCYKHFLSTTFFFMLSEELQHNTQCYIFCGAAAEIPPCSDRIICPFGTFNHNIRRIQFYEDENNNWQ